MKSKESTEKRSTGCCPGFGADFKDFQDMAEKMSACCPGPGDFDDRATMMKEMMEMCCGAKKRDAKDQKAGH